ncbi:MAG: Asp-tRNA(Asn)/Glu-tRNA(Gln) amidotransferase subunit GatB [Rickettsiales bacterium]|nr:Asp-tRNA(Asn)/Glu-tRNA(Gln) amidotransferase subunit GatB [Rickettsiales bacterium]
MSYIIEGKNNKYELTVGCEIHTQVASNSKLFSRSDTGFGAKQNSQVSLVDAAMPGMLPTINEECVKQAVKTGLGINAKINLKSIFDRKNYFYPDSPQGYQISQFLDPIVGEGNVEISLSDGSSKNIRVERIHLEQDAGKSIHDQDPNSSFIDLNRCGVALMEIVSMPDMKTPEEVTEYVKTIRSIVRSLGTSDGDMEKGNLRCDANVSVRKVGEEKLGTRCEIKNLNSFRNISRAVEYEAKRQVDLLENGDLIDQETRLFDAVTGETRTMRSKEDAMDYRYFPDPDLPPLVISQEFVDEIKANMPELPNDKKKRYIADLGISNYDAGVLTSDTDISTYFEKLIKNHDPKLCVTWLSVELLGRMNKLGINFESLKVDATKLSGLLDLIKDGTISGKIAKDVLDSMIESGDEASKIIEEKGLKQVSDSGAIEKIIDEILANNNDKVEEYKAGKDKLFGFFVGQVMQATKGQANPQIVNQILKERLSK